MWWGLARPGSWSADHGALERCADLLGVDLATVGELAAKVEPYVRADGTRIWSLMELERQLQSEVYGRHRGGYLNRRRTSAAEAEPIRRIPGTAGYESFERRSSGCSPVRIQLNYRGLGVVPTGGRPALFLVVSARLVSKV